ncbi:diaminopimelate decarboxylase [Candidatus Parcubacteria bacterium]|nr:diaminopimelate decarboxylase [Candidatus Parcubacteria bacterium]
MPMSDDFKKRLFPVIGDILDEFRPELPSYQGIINNTIADSALSPAAHILDETGIRDTIAEMKKLLFSDYKGKNFFAVKANPNLWILKLMLEMGFGLDCSSPTELVRALKVGAKPMDIMLTSNNTSPELLELALLVGCILNLDDISFLEKISMIPELICFRYNPGNLRTAGSNKIIGNPPEQKYGVRDDQIIEAYKRAIDLGAKKFGIHVMYCSNQRDYENLVETAKMQLNVVRREQDKLGIQFEFINIGGGLGIPYHYDQPPLSIKLMAQSINETLYDFEKENGYVPNFFTESGRYVTGPHGVLAGKCINVMEKYKKFIGVDFCDAADILRAVIYEDSHHEIKVVGKEQMVEVVDIVGPLCENFKLAENRLMPAIVEGDILVVQDTGAHCKAMTSNYNGWGASQVLAFHPDNSVTRVERAQTIEDLIRTDMECDFKKINFN